MIAKIAPRHVQLIVATTGLMGLFTGGFLGVAFHQAAFRSGSELLAGSVALACALGFAYAIVLCVRFVLAPEADHVDPLSLLKAWGAAVIAICAIQALLPDWALEAAPLRSAQILALWGTGVWAARKTGTPG